MSVAKRLEIGEHLKRVPMGYFNKNSLDEITAAVRTTLADIETSAVTILDRIASGFIYALVIGVGYFFTNGTLV